ncbi:DUF4845 domain-containing protein [Beggiatoa leptomitoformis]|uniref:DUF4845 domain-containing protein n=1 Tax=Beggiatoa leptomitoformis TaxID=288004 RepID=A0A2N9YC36_9GAMM|nr:DUF4845 domain-containing protein [Beggiatoa leptomitoformis]ALG66676.1 DUF4845 domain-containing protein [Beggiatoa leptomitoformis]AUI67999.1 DUF4845 domain-containing protein [Beggiatoa leptomitoformis]
MKINKHQQQGMGMWSLLFLLAVLGTIAWVGLKLVPLYLEGKKITMALESVRSQPDFASITKPEFFKQVTKRLEIDGINRLYNKEVQDAVIFERVPKGMRITVPYQAREPLFDKFYFLYDYEHTIEP